MNNRKGKNKTNKRQLVAGIIAVILVVAMVLPMVMSALV